MTKVVNCGNAESPRRSEVAVAEEELSAIAEVWRSQENWDAIRFSHYMCAEDAYQAEGYRAEPKHRNSWSEESQSPHLPYEFVDGAFQGKARVPVAGLNVTDVNARPFSTTTASARSSSAEHACRFFFRDYYAG